MAEKGPDPTILQPKNIIEVQCIPHVPHACESDSGWPIRRHSGGCILTRVLLPSPIQASRYYDLKSFGGEFLLGRPGPGSRFRAFPTQAEILGDQAAPPA
jgi:hypothetical protein